LLLPCFTIARRWADLVLKGLKRGQCERNKTLRRYENRAMGLIVSAGAPTSTSSLKHAPKTTWTMSAPHLHETASPTCAEAGHLGGVVLLGACVETPREKWQYPETQKQMFCTCSTSPVFISQINAAWPIREPVKARGNVMVQILRLPARVLRDCMPDVEFQALLGLQEEYQQSVLETQSRKIAATKRLLRKMQQ